MSPERKVSATIASSSAREWFLRPVLLALTIFLLFLRVLLDGPLGYSLCPVPPFPTSVTLLSKLVTLPA